MSHRGRDSNSRPLVVTVCYEVPQCVSIGRERMSVGVTTGGRVNSHEELDWEEDDQKAVSGTQRTTLLVHNVTHIDCGSYQEVFTGAGFMKPLHLTNLDFPTSAGNKMHSLVRKSSLVRCTGFMKPAPGLLARIQF